jgi:hypothetical protein
MTHFFSHYGLGFSNQIKYYITFTNNFKFLSELANYIFLKKSSIMLWWYTLLLY